MVSTNAPERSRSARSTLALVFIIIFLDILGVTVLSPVLAYIVRRYSSAALAVTLMTVAYSGAQFLAAPLLGRLSDRHGRRPILLLSIVGSAAGYFMFGIGAALWVLLLSRLIDGFTGGNISTATACIADITPPQERARSFGLIGLAFGLGYTLGPALGGALSRINLAAPAFAAGTLSLLSAIVGFFALAESLPQSRRTTTPITMAELNPLGVIAALLRRRVVGAFILVQIVFLFAFTGVNSVTSVLFIEKLGAQPQQLAGLYVAAGLATALVQGGLVGRLVRRYGERRLTMAALVLLAASYLAYLAATAASSFRLLYPISALSGGSSALLFATLGALIANAVSDSEQGKAAGVNAALQSLMNVCGPFWAGAAYDRIAPAAPLWSGAVCLALASLVLTRERGSLAAVCSAGLGCRGHPGQRPRG